MDFIKKGTLVNKYFADDSEFRSKGNSNYKLKSTTNPKYSKFVGQTLHESKWDLISECDYTEGPEFDRAYDIFLEKIRNGQQIFSGPSNVILKKDEKIIFVAGGIAFSEPRAMRVTNSTYAGSSRRTGKKSSFGVGRGRSVSQSKDVIPHIDDGTVTITNKRFIFSGSKKNVNVDLKKINGITVYRNGIRLQRSNKQKIEQFTGFENLSFNFLLEDKKYYITFNGQVIRALIQAGLNSSNTKKLPAKTKTKTKQSTSKPKESNDELLFKYAELYEKGLLTEEEFKSKKKELLGL